MKAAVLKGFGSSATFVIDEVDTPEVAEDEVLVQLYATSINPVDWQTSKAFAVIPNFIRRKPIILGHDLSGVIIKIGSKVTDFKVGDAIFGTNGLSIDVIKDRDITTGTYAEYTSVKVSKIARIPKNLDFYEAATIPLVALTAFQGLKKANLEEGMKVLVIGGSGGVGSMAVQIAKAKGAIVTAVCSTRNVSLVKDLGADAVIDYTIEDYLTMNDNYGVVFNTIGHQSFSTCSNLLNQTGIYIDCAAPSLEGSVGLIRRYTSSTTHKNVFFLYHSSRSDLEEITQLIESERLKPLVAKEINLSEINQGHALSKTGRVTGKISVAIKPKYCI